MNADTRDRAARHPNAGSENCLAVGTRLSDFEITGVLGEGGFGIVYVAYDHALQRTVAIKEYMPGVLAMRAGEGVSLRAPRHQETFALGLKSFINEARFLAQFDHPALVKVYRFWEQNNTAYTAMKFYDGRTIKDIVTHNPELVDEAWCRKVLRQILQALETLYTMQILHRDISPDNIIVQDNGDAVLLDFGSARQIIGDATRGLTVILKPGYAPVEQYAGDASLEQGPFTDLYALSAVMYFAITKTPPPASIGRMISDPMIALTKQAPAGYGEALLAAIDKGLAVLAQDRPQTIAAFRDLLGIVAEEPLPPRVPLSPPRPTPPPAPVAAADQSMPQPPSARAEPAAKPASKPASKPVDMPAAKPADVSRAARPEHARAAPVPDRPATPTPDRRRLLMGAGAAGVLVLAAAGLYAYVQSSKDETFKLAQPQERPVVAAPATVPAAPVPAPAPDAAAASATATNAAADASLDVALASGMGASPGAAGVAGPTPGAAAVPPAPASPLEAALNPASVKPEVKHAPPPLAATYKLHIKPWGTVSVDGKPHGASPPLKQVALTPGKHTVRIVNPSFPEYVTTIDVDKNKPGMIEHDFSAARP